jgi:hypothetical protein
MRGKVKRELTVGSIFLITGLILATVGDLIKCKMVKW